MPELETSTYGYRLLTDPAVRIRKYYCAQSVGDVLGFRTGNANKAPAVLQQRGYRPRPAGQIEPGDVVVWQRLGNDGPGATYGHIGIAGRVDGKPVYVSNFNGQRLVRGLDAGWQAFAPPEPHKLVRAPWNGRIPPGKVRLRPAGSPLEAAAEPVAPSYQQYITPSPSAPADVQEMLAAPQLPDPMKPLDLVKRLAETVVDPGRANGLPGLSPLPSLSGLVGNIVTPPQGPDTEKGFDVGEFLFDVGEFLQANPGVPQRVAMRTMIPQDEYVAEPMLALVETGMNAVTNLLHLSAQLLDRALGYDAERLQRPHNTRSLADMAMRAMMPQDEGDRWGWYELLSRGMDKQIAKEQAALAQGETLGYAGLQPSHVMRAFAWSAATAVDVAPWLLLPLPTPHVVSRQALGRTAAQAAERYGAELLPQIPKASLERWIGDWMHGVKVRVRGTGMAEAVDKRIGGALEKNLLADLEAGGDILSERVAGLAKLVQRRAQVGADVAEQFAARVVDDLRQAKLAPMSWLGMPLPGAARVRDRLRQAVGVRGIDYRLATDPMSLEMRERAKQWVHNLFGVEPMIPFESQAQAFEHAALRRFNLAYAEARRNLEATILPSEFRGAAESASARQHEQALRLLQETGQSTTRYDLDAVSYAEGHIHQEAMRAAHEQMRALNGPNRARLLKTYLNPESGMNRQWREQFHTYNTRSRNASTVRHAQATAIMKGLSARERRALYFWRNVTEDPSPRQGLVRRLADMLDSTGELERVAPGPNFDAQKVAVARELIADDGTVKMAALKQYAPRAHALIQRDSQVDALFAELARREKPIIAHLRSQGVDTRALEERLKYTPIRQAQAMDGAMAEFAARRSAVPGREQSFQKAARYQHGAQMYADVLAEHTDEATGAIDWKGLGTKAPLMTDMEALLHTRISEHTKLLHFAELYPMVKKYGVPMTHPDAEKLIRYLDYRPMPLIFSSEASPAAVARAREAYGDLALALAQHEEALMYREKVFEAARENLRRTRAAELRRLRDSRAHPLDVDELPEIKQAWADVDTWVKRQPLPLQTFDRKAISQQAARDRAVNSSQRDASGVAEKSLRGRTFTELWRGRTADMTKEEALRLQRRLAGGVYGYLGLGRNLTERSFAEIYLALHEDLPEEIADRLLRTVRSRYGLRDPRRWEAVTNYVNEYGDELVRGHETMAQGARRASRSTETSGLLADVYEEVVNDFRAFRQQYDEVVARAQQAEYYAAEQVGMLDDLAEQRNVLQQDLQRTLRQLERAPEAEREALDAKATVYREAVEQLEQDIEAAGGQYSTQRLRELVSGSEAVAGARKGLVGARRRLVEQQATIAEHRTRLNRFGMGQSAEQYEPSLSGYLVPPAVRWQFRKTAADNQWALVGQVLADTMQLNWARGNLLMRPAFHVYNAIDNWVVGPWLAGQMFMFGGGNVGPLSNAATAMRTMLRMGIRDFGWISEDAAMRRLKAWSDGRGLVGRILGTGNQAEVDRWAREVAKMDITEGGMAGVYAAGGRRKQLQGLARVRADQPEGLAEKAVRSPVRAMQKAMEVNRRLGVVLEDIPRVATYITARKNGWSMTEAKRLVDASFVDYTPDVRQPLDDLMRKLTLFWPYQRGRTEQVLTDVIRRPWKGGALLSVQARARGDRPEIAGMDVTAMPDLEDGWSPSQVHLLRHGLRGKFGYLRGWYMPVSVERDEQGGVTRASVAGIPLSARVVQAMIPSPEMERAYALSKGRMNDGLYLPGNGRHILFVRTGLSPFEIAATLQAVREGDVRPLSDMAIPQMQVWRDVQNDYSDKPLLQKVGKAAVREYVPAYLPGGQLAVGLMRKPRETKKPTRVSLQAAVKYRDRKDYEQQRHALTRRQQLVGWGSVRFLAIPEAEIAREMTKEQRAEWEQLLRRER